MFASPYAYFCPANTFTPQRRTWWSHVVPKLYNCLASPHVSDVELLSHTTCGRSAALDTLLQALLFLFSIFLAMV